MQIMDVRHLVPKDKKGRVPMTRLVGGITDVVIHHGATKRGLKGSNYLSYLGYHVNNLEWRVGGYTFGINDDGTILQGYDLNVHTNHVGNHNSYSLGIVLAGDFRTEDPTPEQWASLYWLLAVYLPKVLINKFRIRGHQEMSGYSWKPCPSLDMDQIRRNVSNYSPDIITITKPKEVVTLTTLKRGDRSPDVKTLQENLNALGHNTGTPDGIFGPMTENAVRSFQKASNLLVDGVAGPQTLAKIQTLLKPVAPKQESVTFTLGGRKYKISLI